MIGLIGNEQLDGMKQQHQALFAVQKRYLRKTALIAAAILLYYVFFFADVRYQLAAADCWHGAAGALFPAHVCLA